MGDPCIGVRVLQVVPWQPGEPDKGKGTNIVVLIGEDTHLAFERTRISLKRELTHRRNLPSLY